MVLTRSVPVKPGQISAFAKNNPCWAWGVALGFLPVFSGLLFRTYSYHLEPFWYEQLRQFDFLFVAFEMAVILAARARGLDYGVLAAKLSTSERWAFAIFLATFWVSSVFVSQLPAVSILRIVFWFIHLAFGCAVFHLAGVITQAGTDRFAKGCFVGLCCYLPILATHFSFPPDPASLAGGKIIWSSAVPGYLSVRLFGFTTATLALLAIGQLWHRHRFSSADWWLYGGLTIALALTFWSGTRGGFLAVFFATLALPIVARTKPPVVWCIVVAAATLMSIALSELLYKPDASFGLFSGRNIGLGSDFSTGRYEIWAQSVVLIAERPIFGWGESAIWWLLENNSGHQQPHNALLQLLLSWGAIATAAALYLVYRATRVLFSSITREPTLVTPVLVLLGLAIMSLVDGILYNPRTAILVIVALASALAIASRLSNRSQPARAKRLEAELA